MLTETCCGGKGLLLETPLMAWISKVYGVWAHRLLMETRHSVKPSCLGTNSTLSSQREQLRRSALHFLQMMLYVTSSLPPVSLGGCHSRMIDVSFTMEITFRGPDGTPVGRQEKSSEAERKVRDQQLSRLPLVPTQPQHTHCSSSPVLHIQIQHRGNIRRITCPQIPFTLLLLWIAFFWLGMPKERKV